MKLGNLRINLALHRELKIKAASSQTPTTLTELVEPALWELVGGKPTTKKSQPKKK